MARLSRPLRRYPTPFRAEAIEARDGTRLSAWVALQPRKAPALVIVPGLFTSKDNHVVRRRAVHVYRRWGYHVLTLDMRGNGQSERVPTTAGWKEAEDLLDVVRHLRGLAQVDGVAVYAESLAGTAAAVAARLAGERGQQFADLGVVAVSALHDPAEAIRLYTDPPPGPLRPFARFFTFLLRRSGQPGIRTFRQYHEAGSRRYGLDPDLAALAATPLVPGMTLSGPLLVVHSRDDDLVPVSQVESRLDVARSTRNLAVWVLPWGHHCLHELSDRAWFWGLLEGFVGPQRIVAPKKVGVGQPAVEAVAQA
jgi:pimeloyl-ACP methyl ester carboxylesterase